MSSISPILASIRSPFLRQAVENIGDAVPIFSWDVVKLVAHYFGGPLKICGRDALKKVRGIDIGEDPEITWKQLDECYLKGIKVVYRVPKNVRSEKGVESLCSPATFGTKFRNENFECVAAIRDTQVKDCEAGFWAFRGILEIGKDFQDGEMAAYHKMGGTVPEAHILAIMTDCKLIEMQCNPEDDVISISHSSIGSFTSTTFMHSQGDMRRIFIRVEDEYSFELGLNVGAFLVDMKNSRTGTACIWKLE